jgi:Arc/MetJ-type ribon-helix-helix transcriptional regulator
MYYWANTLIILAPPGINMPKISLDMPAELLADLRLHVGDDAKFVSLADAIRTACRKMLDQLDTIDARHGRIGGD